MKRDLFAVVAAAAVLFCLPALVEWGSHHPGVLVAAALVLVGFGMTALGHVADLWERR